MNKHLTTGLPVSPGLAIGHLALSAKIALLWVDQGKDVIIVKTQTGPEDILGMLVAKGLISTAGGHTSHTAIVARSKSIPAVVGARDLSIDTIKKTISAKGLTAKEGDLISLNGSTGGIYIE